MKTLWVVVLMAVPFMARAEEEVLVLPSDTHVVGCEILGSATYAVYGFSLERTVARLTKKYVDHARELGANVVLLTIQRLSQSGGDTIRPGVFMKCPLPIKTEDPRIRVTHD